MPSLPRIRTRRVGADGRTEVAPQQQPRLAELHGDGLTWIHLEAPTHDEVQLLAARFGWHPLDVEDVLSRRERPKVDAYTEAEGGGYLFAVLHFPVYDAGVGRLNAGELDVFVGPDYLVTLPTVELRPLSRLFQRCYDGEELRHNLFSRGSGRLLYEVLDDLYDYCFPILDKIAFKLRQIDEEIDDIEPRAKERVRDIHKVKQEIISYRKIVRPQRPTLRQLERGVERFLPEELELYFDDIVDASERIWDLLDNYKEVVEALEDTNESLISHQQNDILYVLTIFSVVMLPLTFLTGFFGMNVHFPGFDSATGFIVTLAAMIVVGRLDARLLPLEEVALKRLWAPWRLEYVQSADEQEGCFLCDAAESDDDEAHLVVHRGERAFVLLNKFPYASGHLLVAPYRHGRSFGDLDDDEALEIHRLGAQGLDALRTVYAPEGFNLGWNIARIAGRRRPRPRASACRAALERRHELHARARRRQGDPRASARDAREARGRAWPR